MIEQYSTCPVEQKIYIFGNKSYTVIRHFTGEKDINQLVTEIAVSRANREMGIL